MIIGQQFWMIYGIGQRAPEMRHDSHQSAIEEAKRLARNNPGKTFVVLEAVNAITKREFDTVTFRAKREYQDIPF